jgi:uncharacterized membrane protein YcaP (DUF421 family)
MLLADTQSVTLVQSLGSILHDAFGGDYPDAPLALHQIAARAAIVYLAGLAVVRVGKSRLISRTTSLDVILGFILGSLLSRGITGTGSISGAILASAVIVAIHWILTSMAYRWHGFGNFVKGHERIVVDDGRILTDVMRRANISPHDLVEQMRLKGIDEIAQVQRAYKERNGEISFIRREAQPKVVDVSVQNGIQTVRIAIE